MQRWLFLFVLLAFTLQVPWAAAAAYCAHETDAGAAHFGHHEHKHRAAADAAGQDGGSHADCGVCHLNACKLSHFSTPLAQFAGAPCIPDRTPEAYSGFIPDLPERPSWPAAA